MTETAAHSPAQAEEHPEPMTYLRQWRQVPRTAGFLLGNFPIAVFAFSVLITLFSAGAGLAIVGIGFVILQFTLVTARGMGATWRAWVVRADGRPIPAPRPRESAAPQATGLTAFLRPSTVASDWRALLHQGLLSFLLTMITWVLAVTWVSMGVVGVLYWPLAQIIRPSAGNIGLAELIWPPAGLPRPRPVPDQHADLCRGRPDLPGDPAPWCSAG